MALPRVSSADSVRKAIAEYDAIGAAEFQKKYGFGPALEYFLVSDGKSYDSKAILAAAQGYEHPELGPARNEFSGGKPVKAALARLGFTVTESVGSPLEVQSTAEVIHLVVKWSARRRPDVIERHVEVVDERGAVWWGLFTSSETAWRVSEQWLSRLRKQIENDVDTYVFISGDTCWQTTLHAVEYERERVESDLIPMYYRDDGRHHLWVKLSGFIPLGRDDLLRRLDPVNKPGRPVALGNQTNPLIVRMRATLRVWWVNQGSSFRRARDGGYLWAPVLDKSGRTHDHWQAIKHLRVGDIVLNYANTQIRAWSHVEMEAASSPRPDPDADRSWSDEGLRAGVVYHDLTRPLRLNDIPNEWRRGEGGGGAFTQDGGVKQGYLFHVSDKLASQLRERFPELDFRFNGVLDDPSPIVTTEVDGTLDIDRVVDAVAARGLRISPEVLSQAVAAVRSGKHIIFTGPPGTAKTTLAELIASVASGLGLCRGYMLTTATADWTTYETIGGLKPDPGGGLAFHEGHFLDAIRKDQWLVIDELNRSNFDRAFGQLFTVLSGQAVELPYEKETGAGRVALVPAGATHGFLGADVLEIPSTWRVIATMNVFDKSLLFEMSFALMRRFAFIEVPSPSLPDFHALIDEQVGDDAVAGETAKELLVLRVLKDLGPAVYLDLARFARERRAVSDVGDGELAYEAFYSYLLPQFEGIDEVQGERLYREVKKLVGPANVDRLRRTLTTVLGLESLTEPRAADDAAEEVAAVDDPDIALESFDRSP
jgi:MoxR-like ATPase